MIVPKHFSPRKWGFLFKKIDMINLYVCILKRQVASSLFMCWAFFYSLFFCHQFLLVFHSCLFIIRCANKIIIVNFTLQYVFMPIALVPYTKSKPTRDEPTSTYSYLLLKSKQYWNLILMLRLGRIRISLFSLSLYPEL